LRKFGVVKNFKHSMKIKKIIAVQRKKQSKKYGV